MVKKIIKQAIGHCKFVWWFLGLGQKVSHSQTHTRHHKLHEVRNSVRKQIPEVSSLSWRGKGQSLTFPAANRQDTEVVLTSLFTISKSICWVIPASLDLLGKAEQDSQP